MLRLVRATLTVAFVAGIALGAGCGSGKNTEGQPNPELKIPEVKPKYPEDRRGGLKPPSGGASEDK